MKKFKARYLLKPYFLIPLCLLLLIGLAFGFWYLTPQKPLSVVVVDKTVPATAADSYAYLDDVSNNYRKHVGLYWLMDYLKIVHPETGRSYNHTSDYYGPKIDENGQITESTSLTQLETPPDLLYLSDTYGVEIYDDHGLSAEEMNTVSMCHSSGSVVVGEQDILTTATSTQVRSELEDLFGISSTGWVGRYIYDLQDLTDVPYWAPDMWRAKYGQEWNCSGPGILLVSADGDILVLEEKTDFESKNLLSISITDEYQQEFGDHSVNYYNWFELIEADNATEVIATYSFNVNSTGAEELAAVSDTTTFAAVTRLREEDGGCAYYFAGDFNDYPSNRQISNFMFADTFFRLLSFNRDGDITNFYWNFYEPLMKKIFKDILKNPVSQDIYEDKQIARVNEDGFQVLTDGQWQDFPIKGFNLNAEEPGSEQYRYSRDYSYYASLIQSVGDMGGNCVRTYDLLPPEFYRALCEYNQGAESPVYLIQGVMTPPSIQAQDSFDSLDSIKSNISSTLAAVHGEGTVPGNGTREESSYSYNAAEYVIAYIIDPRFDESACDSILSGQHQNDSYTGRYISASKNGVEALAAQLCDYTLELMQSSYGCMQPVGVSSGAQQLSGASWIAPQQKTYNLSRLEVSQAADGLYFTAYSLDSDDKALLSNETSFSAGYTDDQGAFGWGGYIREVKSLLTGPVLIDRAGLSTNTDMFEQESSVNGLDEREQGNGIVRMLRAADDIGYIGMLIADLNDNWSASSEEAREYTLPLSNNGLWHNTTDRAETTGVVAVESPDPDQTAMQLNDNSENSLMQQMQLSYNETYVYITVLLRSDIDYDTNEMIIGIDTYQRNNGEYYYDSHYYANSQSGMEYIVKFDSRNSASLYVAKSYNRNAGNYESAESYTADYDLVSPLNYGNFTSSNTHFYQTGVTVRIRIPWAMLNFADPSNNLVVNGKDGDTLRTTATDGMIFSLLIGNKEDRDTAYIFPQSKTSAGYKRLEPEGWSLEDVSYALREKESCVIIRRYFAQDNR